MNEIIQKGIDSAMISLTYWGCEKENLLNFNKNIAISSDHELSLENCDHAIAAAQAQLDEQLKIAKELQAKNELIQSDYEEYLAFLIRIKDTLTELYEKYPNPVLKVTIETLSRVITVIEAIIHLFS